MTTDLVEITTAAKLLNKNKRDARAHKTERVHDPEAISMTPIPGWTASGTKPTKKKKTDLKTPAG
jgi:hypothetical protein